MRYIGCNFNNGTKYGGIDSSFCGEFKNEQVLIENGIGDIIPCIIGDISDIYTILKEKISKTENPQFETLCADIYDTIEEYFNGIDNINQRMIFYKPLDDIDNFNDIGKVSDLKGKGAAMCVERSMVAQNLLNFLGIKSFYKSSGIIKNGNKEIHSYNLVEYNGNYYIFDASIPTINNNRINPLIATIPKEVYEAISNPQNSIGYSVETNHYNPIRKNDVEIIYDSGRKNIYYTSDKNNKSRN